MTIQHVLKMGNPQLASPSLPVTIFGTTALQTLLEDMYDTMQAENGVGIAAPQIGQNLRVIMFGFEANSRYPKEESVPFTVLINPSIEILSEEWVEDFEGCLSVPGTGDIQLSLVQKIPLAGAIVVTTPQQVATNDASKALTMFEKTNIPVLGVIENMSLHLCEACGHTAPLFGKGGAEQLVTQHHTTLLGQLPLHQAIGQHADEGTPTACTSHPMATHFLNLALQVALRLNTRPLNYAEKFPPIVSES